MPVSPVATLVDQLIAAQKAISGIPEWRHSEHDRRELRLISPLTIDGASTGAHIEIKSYPNSHDLRYRLLLIVEKCVYRVDHVNNEHHTNSFDRPSDLKEYSFCEPHYHAWQDNKRFCTKFSLPSELPNARLMPVTVRTFDSALRWFCGELNIEQPQTGLITLPSRVTLL